MKIVSSSNKTQLRYVLNDISQAHFPKQNYSLKNCSTSREI